MTKESSVFGKKDSPEYEINPSVTIASNTTKVGTRKIMNKTGDKCMIVSESGEILAPAGFHEIVEVDRTQFVKVYLGGVTAFNDLSSPGAKVFQMVYSYVLDNANTDIVYLYYKSAKNMARATFDRGVVELLNKEIIYKSTIPNQFFLNVNYMFNGNRLALVKEYRVKEEHQSQKRQQNLFD